MSEGDPVALRPYSPDVEQFQLVRLHIVLTDRLVTVRGQKRTDRALHRHIFV